MFDDDGRGGAVAAAAAGFPANFGVFDDDDDDAPFSLLPLFDFMICSIDPDVPCCMAAKPIILFVDDDEESPIFVSGLDNRPFRSLCSPSDFFDVDSSRSSDRSLELAAAGLVVVDAISCEFNSASERLTLTPPPLLLLLLFKFSVRGIKGRATIAAGVACMGRVADVTNFFLNASNSSSSST